LKAIETTEETLGEASLQAGIEALRDIGALFYQRNWSVGTSSNYSIVLSRDPFRLLLTASGKDKRRLAATDLLVVDAAGKAAPSRPEKPSAETALHLMLAQRPDIGSVLHTHSIWGTLLSDWHGDAGGLWIEGYEMLKGLAGITTHEHAEWVPIFPNSQDISALAWTVQQQIDSSRGRRFHGFLLRKHGLYTWGRDVEEARRHVEIFEFLFEVVARRYNIETRVPDP
jgi:methylthioribulose-1-phosphate dehydratase